MNQNQCRLSETVSHSKRLLFFPEESMRWLIASVPPCLWWFMGASVSRSVSSRQEFTDKEAVGQTSPSRDTLKTVRKTGSSKPTQQQPRCVLVPALSLCETPCVALPFHFNSARVLFFLFCSNIHHYELSSRRVLILLKMLTFYVLLPSYCISLLVNNETLIPWAQRVLEGQVGFQ